MKVTRERTITLRYREATNGKQARLVIDVTAEEDDLPHEHRHDLKEIAAEMLGVPLDSLPKDVEVSLKHPAHSHPHPHEPMGTQEAQEERGKASQQ